MENRVIMMDKKSPVKNSVIVTAILFAVFVIYTICVKNVDVAAIGPEGSSVGFSSVNGAIAKTFSYNEFFYDCSKVIGLFSFITIGAIALTALCQVVKRKGIFKADPDCYAMGVTYVATGILYVLFEKLIINYRPVILDEGLEASFPSSHTMLSVCVFITASIWIRNRIKYDRYVSVMLCTFAVLMVICRLISGVHWFTDIIGGVIAGALLTSIYMTQLSVLQSRAGKGKD